MRSLIILLFALALPLGAQNSPSQVAPPPDTIIVYKHCPPTPSDLYVNPGVVVDSIFAVDGSEFSTPPRPVNGMKALSAVVSYPPIAIRAGIEGTVWIRVAIDERGTPSETRITRSDAEIFNGPTEAAVRSSAFLPAESKGRVVPATVIVAMRFCLHGEPRVDFDIAEIRFREMSGMVGPRYMITLRKNGTAEFDGRGFMNMSGLHIGTFSPVVFRRLSVLLGWFCFFDTSSRTARYGISDGEDESIEVLYGGQWMKRESDGKDERVWGVAKVIEGCAQWIKWSKVDNGK